MELGFQAYHYAWITWMTITLGCTGLLLLHHATKAKWTLVILRVLETGARLLPLMAFLGVVIVANVLSDGSWPAIFPWIGELKNHHLVVAKVAYLNKGFFAVRYAIYFLIWIALSRTMINSSLREDKSGDKNEAQMRANWGALGLVIYFLSVTFAYTDWVMSLDPKWTSTIFPVWFIMAGAMMTLTFGIIYAVRRMNQAQWEAAVDAGVLKDWGNMLLTLTLIWAYFSLSQFLIMWSANIPEEVIYYTKRFENPLLLAMGAFLILFQWLVPFILLLAPRTKKRPDLLIKVAYLSLTMKFIDIFWTVVPFFMKGIQLDVTTILVNVVMMAAMGAVWFFGFYTTISRFSALPAHDARLEEALSHAR